MSGSALAARVTALPWSSPHAAARGRRGARAPAADDLVLRARDGDAEAFGCLYDRHVELVYRYVLYRVGSHPLAEDLTSETFLRALHGIGGYRRSGRDFGAWLVGLARELVAGHLASGRHRREVSAELLADLLGALPEPDGPADGPERALFDAITSRTLLAAVDRLGPEQRECVVLRFLHGRSVAETALIMGREPGAVKALQHRAVRTLARLLPDDLRS
ncbi:sigma-70 family RNA polymerase sigma factor [Actinomadura parmotrematis]|uniref:Sigma-70 family RNA polymerase sigma factor n=1 Tax=Actinomadura parmotrematis TaxID=2864039 RepID=A0ABS7FXJ3_9ACTN|nr:sigma-70 family RNA polymerase sigma factor [Actinomadura parmotrematis]MBW8485026.1 sigma-70 family RNA polymerase sigma factor [Actinomadura parmotrematis]